MNNTIVIRNENDAWETLQSALVNDIDKSATLKFEGWPVLSLTIEGKDFHGSIPTRIMPPILDLQHEIYRIYCQARYDTTNWSRLGRLSSVVQFRKKGSSNKCLALFFVKA